MLNDRDPDPHISVMLPARGAAWIKANGVERKLKVDQSIPSTNHSRRQIATSQAVSRPFFAAGEEAIQPNNMDAEATTELDHLAPLSFSYFCIPRPPKLQNTPLGKVPVSFTFCMLSNCVVFFIVKLGPKNVAAVCAS